jgi:hypothetical protein
MHQSLCPGAVISRGRSGRGLIAKAELRTYCAKLLISAETLTVLGVRRPGASAVFGSLRQRLGPNRVPEGARTAIGACWDQRPSYLSPAHVDKVNNPSRSMLLDVAYDLLGLGRGNMSSG